MSTERISAVDGTSEGSGGAATLGCSEGASEGTITRRERAPTIRSTRRIGVRTRPTSRDLARGLRGLLRSAHAEPACDEVVQADDSRAVEDQPRQHEQEHP